MIMKGNERKKEKKKEKADGSIPKKKSEYQKEKTSRQDMELNFNLKSKL
jgi:hypothetical protein